MSNGKPKDHYVPQCYLNAFALEGLEVKNPHIYQYMDNSIVSPRISDIASEKDFYTFKDKKTGLLIRDIDNILTNIESAASLPLKKIIEKNNLDLSDEEFSYLAQFLAVLVVRTPGFISSQKSMEEEFIKEHEALQAIDKNNLKKRFKKAGISLDTGKELEDIQDFLINKKYTISFGDSRGYFISKGLEMAKNLALVYFQNKTWHLLISNTDKVFITSDNPVSIFRPIYIPEVYNAGYGNGTLVITISPKLAILLRDKPYIKNKIILDGQKVDYINKNIMKFSDNYIYSNLKSKKIFETYKTIGNKHFQKTRVIRHKFAPYIFFQSQPISVEPVYE